MPDYGTAPPPGALELFLREDGVELEGGGEEKMCKCFSPHHDDNNPSMRVNVGKGLYYCHTCEISGNAITYLKKIRGLSHKETYEKLEGLGYDSDRIKEMERLQKERTKGKGAPWRKDLPKEWWDPKKKRAVGQRIAAHPYKTLDGELMCVRLRWAPVLTGDKPPKVVSYRPAKGGYYVRDPWSPEIPEEYRWKEKYPLYRVRELMDRISKVEEGGHIPQIWIVEGEKCVDAVLRCPDSKNAKGPIPVTCLYGGQTTRFDKLDLSPLQGRNVVILADADAKGHKDALIIGNHLKRKYDCTVRVSLPKSRTDGWDVAAALGADGWDGVRAWIQQSGVEDLPAPTETTKETASEVQKALEEKFQDPEQEFNLESNQHYTILGLDEDAVIFRIAASMQIFAVSYRQMLRKETFLRLAPLEYWHRLLEGKNFSDAAREWMADKMLRSADSKGVIDLTKAILGRGGFYEDGKPHYYLGGTKVLAPDDAGLLTRVIGLKDVSQVLRPGPEIIIKPDPKGLEYAAHFYATMMRYGWADSAFDGAVFCGWLATSLAGGCLDTSRGLFRPHCWIVAPRDRGKTFLSDPVATAILGNALSVVGSSTEAGIAAMMQDHALPLWVDEFEPGEGRSASWYAESLGLFRLSTSGQAQRARGGQMRSQNATPRFSAFASSIAQVKMNSADESRFVTIGLSRQKLPTDKWLQLEKDIRAAIQPERSGAIRAAIIQNTGRLVDMAKKMQEHLASDPNIETRDSQIYAALSAGATLLRGDTTIIKPRRPGSQEEDEWKNFEVLMSTLMPFDQGRQLSIGLALENLMYKGGGSSYEAFCANYGVKWDRLAQMVLFAHRFNGLGLVMKRSEVPNLNLSRYLSELPGMQDVGRPYIGQRRSRCLGISLEQLQEHGFFERPYEEEADG